MMVKQREEKLQEKERELLKREQEVNEKLARMVGVVLNLIINNAYCDMEILELALRKCSPFIDKCRRFSNSQYNTSPATFSSSGYDKHYEAIVVLRS